MTAGKAPGMRSDLLVLGAGPAGVAAALEASAHGLDVILLDEAASAGGQVYRAPAFAGTAMDQDARAGMALRRELAGSRVRTLFGRRVWSVSPRFSVDAVGADGPETAAAPRLIAATGALERLVPFPGWTLPGVIGLAASTILLKSQAIAPGRRVVVAGCGPLLAAVAAKLIAAGVDVPAIADLSGRADWGAALPRLAVRPGQLAQGAAWAFAIGRARVPVLFRHTVLRAEGDGALQRVQLGPAGDDGIPAAGGRWVEADALCVGHGLVPGAEATRLLHAAHRFDPARAAGCQIPMRTAAPPSPACMPQAMAPPSQAPRPPPSRAGWPAAPPPPMPGAPCRTRRRCGASWPVPWPSPPRSTT